MKKQYQFFSESDWKKERRVCKPTISDGLFYLALGLLSIIVCLIGIGLALANCQWIDNIFMR